MKKIINLNYIKILLLAIFIVSCEQEPSNEEVQVNEQTDIVLVAKSFLFYNHDINCQPWIYMGYYKTANDETAEQKIERAYSVYRWSTSYNPEVNCDDWNIWLGEGSEIHLYNAQPDFIAYSKNNYNQQGCISIDAIPVKTLWMEYNLETLYNNGDQIFIQ